jgi:hypothetical protein
VNRTALVYWVDDTAPLFVATAIVLAKALLVLFGD